MSTSVRLRVKTFGLAGGLAWGLAIAAPQSLARAGGGGGYHGSSHSSGGSSSSSSSSHSSVSHYSSSSRGGGELTAADVKIIILVIVILITIFVLFGRRRGNEARSKVSQGYRGAGDAKDPGMAKLLASDHEFNEDRFCQRVKAGFLAIQQEWSERKLIKVVALTTDGVRERFQILLEMEKLCGFTNITRDVEVDEVKIVNLEVGQAYDAITVQIAARAVDYYVKIGTDERVSGRLEPAPFVEYWTMLRRTGAKTAKAGDGKKSSQGLLEGHCPACGAPIQLSDRGTCNYCGAVVNSGEFDWVLSEITQSEADDRDTAFLGEAPLQQFVAKDPAFSTAYVEDRVALLFWRLRWAEVTGTLNPLTSMVAPAWLAAQRDGFRQAQGPAGERRFFADSAVGAVRLIKIEPATDTMDRERLTIRVAWSGRLAKVALPTFLPPDYDQAQPFLDDFVLERRAKAQTPVAQGLRANRCPACGAPLGDGSSPTCGQCGATQNDATLDWVLVDLHSAT